MSSQPAPLAKKKTPRKRTLAEKAIEATTREQTATESQAASLRQDEVQPPPAKKRRITKRKQPTVFDFGVI